MNLIPEFKLGLLNGWFFPAAYFIINHLIMTIIPKEVRKRLRKHPETTKKEKIILRIQCILFFGAIIYTIFVSLKLGTFWF